jgi:hypothetical protein
VRRAPLSLLVCALVLLSFVATAGAASSAGARGTDDGVQVEVEAGYDGRYLIGRRLPVRVSVRSDRLVRGAVEVFSRELDGRWTLPIEVPGASEKDVVVVVPTPAQFELSTISVRVVGAGAPVVVQAELEGLGNEELVGLLPELGVGELPAPFALPMEAGTALFVAVDDATLGAAGALDPLGTIVAGPDELGRLDAAARAAVLDWVDRGGRLVVDAALGTQVAGLPAAWQPAEAGRAPSGLGEVRLSEGAAAAGRWTDVLEPTPTVSVADLNRFGGMQFPQFESVGQSIARDAGLSRLDLPWLFTFLGAYVVIVGPLLWVVLRRRRAALGWVLIPAVAVLFTGIAFVVGSDLRGGTRAAQGSIVELSPAGARATTIVGTVSRSGGDGRTQFPAGWTAGSVTDIFGGFGFPGGGGDNGGGDLTVTQGVAGAETDQALAAGGFGLVRGSGPVSVEGGLVVTAHTEADEIVGTVRNDLPFAVRRAAVFLGRAAEALGTIEPGQEVTFRFNGVEAPNGDVFSVGEGEVWREETGMFGTPLLDSPVNLGLWNDAIAALGPNARMRGTVTAVGWTSGYTAPIDAVGDDVPGGRSAVVARATVAAGPDGTIARGGARRELIRGFDGVEVEGGPFGVNLDGVVWRFVLPPGAAGPLQLDVPAYFGRAEVWDGSRWLTIDDQLEGDGNAPFDPFAVNLAGTRPVEVPGDAVRDGIVWVRGTVAVDLGMPLDASGLELRTPPSRDA